MKQKRQAILIVFSIVLLLFIAGCGKGDVGERRAQTTPFLGGAQGLEIKFLTGLPPDEVIDSDSFPFQAIVGLKNVGEYKLGRNQVKVSLVGFLPDDFRSDAPTDFANDDLIDRPTERDPSPRLRDSEGYIIESVETSVTFPTNTKQFRYKGTLTEDASFTFRADVCYKYGTEAVSEICVLENMIDVADDAICDPNEEKGVFSSGSPIGVTSFRQNAVGEDRIQFSFDIEHFGSGDVFGVENSDVIAARDAANNAADKALVGSIATASVYATANTATRTVIDEIVKVQDDIKGVADDVMAVAGDILNSVGEQNVRLTAARTAAANAVSIADRARAAQDSAIATNNDDVRDAAKVVADAADALVEAANSIVQLAAAVDCPKTPSDRRQVEDKIRVTVDTGLAAGALTCTGLNDVPAGAATTIKTGSVRLVNGKRTITCTQDLSIEDTNFKRGVDITLDFNYFDSIDKKVLVKQLVS
jgi:hypothetical protein